MTIQTIKEKLKTHTGTAVSSMMLQLKDLNNTVICTLSDDNTQLGYYSPQDG